jgi:selenocysteine lyase/cysteine desulfurase
MNLEQYFEQFRCNTVGYDETFDTPYGRMPLIYADWTASGRLYRPVEDALLDRFGPFVANTHTESNYTSTTMTRAYHEAHRIIKEHVNAGPNDVIVTAGTGMTGVINKFQRILGLRVPSAIRPMLDIPAKERPIVFVTHMEHHSNQTSWLETICDVEWLEPNELGLVEPAHLEQTLTRYQDRPLKIGSFTACSNVTGIHTPFHQLAAIMHRAGGFAFVDFAASGPYVQIDMHPADPDEHLDAVFFSPHKFLGGPGTSGVLIFNSELYNNEVPDDSGGGTVAWTNPWGGRRYWKNIELREDAGTPGFLQCIRAALAIRLKDEMGVENIHAREQELLQRGFEGLRAIPGIEILAGHIEDRLPFFSFVHPGIHYNLFVKLLNDRFGIQSRGGCSCAGTYGHYLLHMDKNRSQEMSDNIDSGDPSYRVGWVRISLHPTTTNDQLEYILDAVRQTVENIDEWKRDYTRPKGKAEWKHFAEDDYLADVSAMLRLPIETEIG